jgi:leader peptidase (prepilin peptidase)/N-methyltransferase
LPPQIRDIVIMAIAFAFGAAIGSFLNVVIYRLPREDEGLSLTRPKLSFCPQCKEQIRWYDNVPLLGYLWLAGRCRACKVQIPLRYFCIELLTAALFVMTAYFTVVEPLNTGGQPSVGLCVIFCGLIASMVAVTFIDLDHQIIPDKIDKPGMALSVVSSLLVPALHLGNGDLDTLVAVANRFGGSVAPAFGLTSPHAISLVSCLLGMIVGAGVIYSIGVLGKLAFKKDAMGFGDVKYMGMLGGFLGWKGVLLTLLVACLVGSVIGIAVKLIAGNSHIPFGPFLSLGALIVIFWREPLMWGLFVWYPAYVRGESAVYPAALLPCPAALLPRPAGSCLVIQTGPSGVEAELRVGGACPPQRDYVLSGKSDGTVGGRSGASSRGACPPARRLSPV